MGTTAGGAHAKAIGGMPSLSRAWVFAAALALAVAAFTPEFAAAADGLAPKRVLIISTGSRLAPGFVLVDQQILRMLRSPPALHVDIYAENLDLVRFPAGRSRHVFLEYLAEKYADTKPDLVILVFVGNLGIPGRVLSEVFPETPIVVAGLTEEELRSDQFGGLVGGFAQRTDPAATLALIRKLHPDVRRIVVISGTAGIDREVLRRVVAAAQPLKSEIDVEIWDHLGVEEVRNAVTRLPPQTAVLFARMFADGAGQPVISSEVAQRIGREANAPVYVLTDANFGTGAVGGSVASIEAFGQRAGELAKAILLGGRATTLPFEARGETVPTFDWRALKRWGIDETRLPAGSVVKFRPQSIWDLYRWPILGVLAVVLLQSVMIGSLILQSRRLRRTRNDLEEERELIEFASGAGELGLWSRDVRTDQLWVNAPMRSLFEFEERGPLHRDDILARVHPDDRARAMAEVAASERAGKPFQLEYRVCLANRGERWVLLKGRSVPGLAGRVTRRMGVVLDITERKLAEALLRKTEETLRAERAFLRQVIDVNPNHIFVKDRDGRFTLVNQAMADLYGVTAEEMIGKTSADFNLNADEVSAFRKIDLEVMSSGKECFVAEERVTDSHGNVRWVQTVKRPLQDIDGRTTHVVGASTDITQRRQTEIELQEQRSVLAHVGRVSTMGELAASLAHELNQPLTAILSNAQAGLRFANQVPVDLDEVRAALADIVEANGRAADVIRHTRSLVRKEESLDFRQVDLADLVGDVVALVHSDAILHEVRVVLDIEESLPPVRGDAVQLQQVILNLLLNAFDAMKTCPPRTRRVEVRVEHADDAMNRVAVCDSGPGIGADELERIFEPFYSTKCDGMGMGLPICRSIIEAHEGRVWAESNPGTGAAFYFTVPLYAEA